MNSKMIKIHERNGCEIARFDYNQVAGITGCLPKMTNQTCVLFKTGEKLYIDAPYLCVINEIAEQGGFE